MKDSIKYWRISVVILGQKKVSFLKSYYNILSSDRWFDLEYK